jgi:uncharacterized membrane protein (DUF441 family)
MGLAVAVVLAPAKRVVGAGAAVAWSARMIMVDLGALSPAATPDLATTRMMQAIMVLYNWTALAFDIKMAYINADIPPDGRRTPGRRATYICM